MGPVCFFYTPSALASTANTREDRLGMTLEPLHPIQAERFRAMSPAEKWEVAKGLLRTARQTRRAGLALRHPEWSPQQIEQELARELARART